MSALSKDSLSESLTYIAVQMRLGRAGTLNSGTAGFILEVRDLLAAKDAEIARLRGLIARLTIARMSPPDDPVFISVSDIEESLAIVRESGISAPKEAA